MLFMTFPLVWVTGPNQVLKAIRWTPTPTLLVAAWKLCAPANIEFKGYPQDHAHLVNSTIIHKRNSRRAFWRCLLVQCGLCNATTNPVRVSHRDLVTRGAVLEEDLETRPRLGDAWGNAQEEHKPYKPPFRLAAVSTSRPSAPTVGRRSDSLTASERNPDARIRPTHRPLARFSPLRRPPTGFGTAFFLSRWLRIYSTITGSSMQAMIRTPLPRFSRCCMARRTPQRAMTMDSTHMIAHAGRYGLMCSTILTAPNHASSLALASGVSMRLPRPLARRSYQVTKR